MSYTYSHADVIPTTRGERLYSVWVLFAFGTGIIAHLSPYIYPYTPFITTPLLLIVNVVLLGLLYRTHQDIRLWWWAIPTFCLTLGIEALGVATGKVFGAYTYGATLYGQWLEVPIVIALNWTLLILATNTLAGLFTTHPIYRSLLAGLAIVGFDLMVEPVAIALDYWTWSQDTVPLQNYVAWLVIGCLFSLPLNIWRIRYESTALLAYLLAQVIFFGTLLVFI